MPAPLGKFIWYDAVTRMTASIAHEINQPLAAMMGNANAALRWMARTPPDVAEARESLEQIVREGQRAADVIQSVRSIFKSKKLARVSITAITIVMLNGTGAAAAELPTFELMGFPITSHQVAVVGSAHVQEQSPNSRLTLGGMPASPHQIAVLTPRSRAVGRAAAKTGSSVR
jgi:phospho-acceptor domain-containing protein